MQKEISNWFTLPFIGLVRIYQYIISPIFPPSCRFFPTCSSYSVEALKKYGLFKGFWLTAQRIGKCRPGRFGGYDPVP